MTKFLNPSLLAAYLSSCSLISRTPRRHAQSDLWTDFSDNDSGVWLSKKADGVWLAFKYGVGIIVFWQIGWYPSRENVCSVQSKVSGLQSLKTAENGERVWVPQMQSGMPQLGHTTGYRNVSRLASFVFNKSIIVMIPTVWQAGLTGAHSLNSWIAVGIEQISKQSRSLSSCISR